jgi:NAD(P)-dependent dehydrogenase (short-subunit alcohol dehydrogenase family)
VPSPPDPRPFDLAMFDLRGRTALVTGGNSGIGLGMADALAAAGASVAIWGTNAARNDEAVAHLRRHGGEVHGFVCDVGDEEAVERAFAATVEALGGVDACLANAGVGGAGQPFVEMTLAEWRRVLRVNLDGAFLTLRAATRHLVARGGGSLVAVTSGSAYQGQARGQHYGASKAGLIALVRAIAVEHARDGIRANLVMPGWVATPMTGPLQGWAKFEERVIGRTPIRRWGRPEDFGGIAVYLASDASRWHTGDVITIDGGYNVF